MEEKKEEVENKEEDKEEEGEGEGNLVEEGNVVDKPEKAKCKAKPLSVSEVISHMVTVQVSID